MWKLCSQLSGNAYCAFCLAILRLCGVCLLHCSYRGPDVGDVDKLQA